MLVFLFEDVDIQNNYSKYDKQKNDIFFMKSFN